MSAVLSCRALVLGRLLWLRFLCLLLHSSPAQAPVVRKLLLPRRPGQGLLCRSFCSFTLTCLAVPQWSHLLRLQWFLLRSRSSQCVLAPGPAPLVGPPPVPLLTQLLPVFPWARRVVPPVLVVADNIPFFIGVPPADPLCDVAPVVHCLPVAGWRVSFSLVFILLLVVVVLSLRVRATVPCRIA